MFLIGGIVFVSVILPGISPFLDFALVFAGVVYVLVMALMLGQFMKLKKVEIDEECLYVSNYRQEIKIPFSDVYEVTEMRWLEPFWITLHLVRPSEFGDKIVFAPPYRYMAFWSRNPLVDELKTLVTAKRVSRFIPPVPERRLFDN